MTLEKNPMHQAHGGTYTGDFLNGKRSELREFIWSNPWEFVQRGMQNPSLKSRNFLEINLGIIKDTPRKTNMEPENGPGKGDSFWKPSFSGSMLVFGGVMVNQFNTLRRPLFPWGAVALGGWAPLDSHDDLNGNFARVKPEKDCK